MAQAKLDVTDQLGHRIVQIEKDPFVIGRRVMSDLHLPSGEVSRDHAEIAAVGDGFEIRDRDSRYGTFVNGAEFVFLLSDAPVEESRSLSAVGEMHQVAVLLEGLRALSSGRVLDDVLALVIDSAISVGGAERGFIMLVGDDDKLEFKLGRSRDRVTLPGTSFKTSRKIPEEVFRTGQARIEADLLEGDLAAQHEGTVALGIRNVLCMPLRLVRYVESAESTTEDRRVGVLYLDSREKVRCWRMGPARRWSPKRRFHRQRSAVPGRPQEGAARPGDGHGSADPGGIHSWGTLLADGTRATLVAEAAVPSTTLSCTGPPSRRRGSTRRWPRQRRSRGYSFVARRPAGQARRGSKLGICDPRVTPPGGMPRREVMTLISDALH